jgi:ribosomal protein S18 acetylase RimI-like enzyme
MTAADHRIVREVTDDDVEFLRRMLFVAWLWSPDRARTGPSFEAWCKETPRDKYVHGFTQRLGDGGVIADVNGAPAGAAWYRVLTEDEGSVGFVAVDVPEVVIAVAENHRGRGIGRLLIEQLTSRAMRDGHRALSLHVDGDNAAAQRLYLRCGFVNHRHTDSSVVMVKQLRDE